MSGPEPPKHTPDGLDDPRLHRRQPLPASEERVWQTVEAIPLPVAIIAVGGEVLYVNRALEETSGYKRDRLIGRSSSCLFPRMQDRRALAKRTAEEGRVRGLEVQGRQRRGTQIWLSVWQQRFTYDGKECLLTLLQDVTRAKREKGDLEEQVDALEQLLRSSDQERELIAFDIHDGVIQDMTAALMHLQGAARTLPDGKPAALEQLKRIDQLLREGINEARRLIDGVRLPDLDQLGLFGALELLVRRIADNKGLEIEFDHRVASDRFSSQAETAIYRITQECLNNVWRHSKSTRARVELIQTEEGIRLTIEDWGTGFNPDRVDDTRFGLAGVRQRARLLGGSVQIRSTPGGGCAVCVTVPAATALPAESTS